MTSASILLVEDETLIRVMTAEMVEELGHRVVAQASKVSEGVILAKTAEFDLAMLDINIGGGSVLRAILHSVPPATWVSNALCQSVLIDPTALAARRTGSK